jgi:acyl-coenzyme A synthetase/AMP-(fatty) acid ligase
VCLKLIQIKQFAQSALNFGKIPNDPERTAAAFTRNPLNLAYPETIYRTGDLAYRNERGELMFKGRRDFQIKHAGHRIELGETEAAAGTVGGVETCGCVYDGERQKIALFYSGAAEPGAVTDALKSKLQSYMVPGIVTKLNVLPRAPAGKIDRTALKAGLGTV